MVEGNSFYSNGGRRRVEPWVDYDNPLWADALASFDLTQEHLAKLNTLVDEVMDGVTPAGETEIEIHGRWYKVQIVSDVVAEALDEAKVGDILGILGCTIDISDVRARTALEIENTRLQADEQLAKEQSRLKSQFLANMCVLCCSRSTCYALM